MNGRQNQNCITKTSSRIYFPFLENTGIFSFNWGESEQNYCSADYWECYWESAESLIDLTTESMNLRFYWDIADFTETLRFDQNLYSWWSVNHETFWKYNLQKDYISWCVFFVALSATRPSWVVKLSCFVCGKCNYQQRVGTFATFKAVWCCTLLLTLTKSSCFCCFLSLIRHTCPRAQLKGTWTVVKIQTTKMYWSKNQETWSSKNSILRNLESGSCLKTEEAVASLAAFMRKSEKNVKKG